LGQTAPVAAGEKDPERRLSELVSAAREQWPDLEVEVRGFRAYLEEKVAGSGRESLAPARAADLYLTYACGQGDSRAIGAFEARYSREIAVALRRYPASEDLLQALRERLFVPRRGEPRKILSYSGRGPLGAWACAVALRLAVTSRRGGKQEVPLEEGPLLEVPSSDPELRFIKTQHLEEFRRAVRTAFGELSSRERNVLRLYLIDGLNIDQIGAAYDTHRATVARWIAKSRETILFKTRQELAARLRLRGDRLDSFLKLIDSQLDASVGKLLRL
jgi:RNA polymerase sigma-70 factor, ECF subfamily